MRVMVALLVIAAIFLLGSHCGMGHVCRVQGFNSWDGPQQKCVVDPPTKGAE